MGEQYPRKERIKLNIVTCKPRTSGGKLMRRKHQQTYHKRENIRNIPNSGMHQQPIGKLYCKQVSQKENSITEDPKAIEQTAKIVKTKISKDIIQGIISILLMIVFIIIVILAYNRKPADKKDDVILRHYNEILKRLDDAPEDISSSKYEANVPSIIQKDIDKMLEMGEDACVIYYNDRKDQVIIEPSQDSELGYRVRFQEAIDPYSVISIDELESNISFYKSKDTLIIYGTPNNIRSMYSYYMDKKGIHYLRLDNRYVDLYGTSLEFNEARNLNDYATLTRNGTEFSLYHSGNQIYSINFEGGDIEKWDFYYLSTKTGDCYNVYYSTEPQNPWIKFYKVAENVDEILEDERVSIADNNGNRMEFPTFKIGDKRYAQIPDATTERTYGQNFGGNNRNEENVEVNFTANLVEISATNSSRVELIFDYDSWRGDSYVWYLYYYFQVGDRECFIRKESMD